MGQSGKISVVITCYNYGRYLAESLGSVLGQSYGNFEVVIVDDGSTDDSLDIARGLAMKYHDCPIKVISQKNMGVQAARNRGIAESSGEYVLALDADDILPSHALEEFAKALEDPSVDIAYGHIETFGLYSKTLRLSEYSDSLMRRKNIIPISACFRRRLPGVREGYDVAVDSEDYDFWVSLIEKGARPRLIDRTLLYYRTSASSRSRKIYTYSHMVKLQLRTKHPAFFGGGLYARFGPRAAGCYFRMLMPVDLAKGLLKATYFIFLDAAASAKGRSGKAPA